MTYPDNPQQPHSNPYDKAYPVSPFESEPQQPQQQVQQVQQVQQPQQPDQWQQSQQQASWQGPPVPPQGASQSGGMGVQPNTMTYGPNMQPPQQIPYTANPYAPAPVAVDPQKKNHLGLIAMVMGLLCIPSLIFMGWWPPIIAITTLVVSIVAFVRRKNYVEQNRMTGFAITGLVLSSVCIAIIIVGIVIFLVFEVADSGYDNYDSYRSYLPDNSLEDA